MEDNNLPPVQPASPIGDSLEDAASQTIASYSLPAKNYPLEKLEVHTEGDSGATLGGPVSSAHSVPFSRRKAMVVSLVITLLVVLLTGGVALFFLRGDNKEPSSSQLNVPSQDITVNEEVQGALPELQGTKDALLVNGDLIAKGTIKVVSGAFVSTISPQTLSADQTVSLPNASGIICLDSNNCNFATLTQLTQVQTTQVQTGGGVTTLNNLAGALSLQGSLNRITVATANGAITLSTPQDLDANANVQFGGLALGTGLAVTSGGTGVAALTANGLLVGNGTSPVTAITAGAAGQCLVSTVGAPAFQACPGSAGVTSLNSLSGALTLQGTANQISVVSGGSTITLSTPQDIATTSNPVFAGLTSPALQSTGTLTLTSSGVGNNLAITSAHDIVLTAGPSRQISASNYFHSTSSIDIDARAGIGNGNTIVPGGATDTHSTILADETFNVDCATGCAGVYGAAELGSAANPTFLSGLRGVVKVGDTRSLGSSAGVFVDSALLGTGSSLTNNYGVYVSSQTAGTNDYGVYIQGADTYALFVDAGATRLDGNLEVNGGTISSAGALALTPSGALTLGVTGQTATLQGTTTTIASNGAGNDISLTAADQIILDAGTSVHVLDDTDIDGHLAVGASATVIPLALLSISETFTSADNCSGFGCYGTLSFVTADNTAGASDGVSGFYSRVSTAANVTPYTLDTASAFTASNPTTGSNSTIGASYGLYVENMTAATTDIGVYIQGADTYALHVDSGATRLDGTLELQTLGTTNTATYLCRNAANQIAACTTGSGSAYTQGGNNFGGTGTLGLTSNDTLNLITNNVTRMSVTGAGATTITGGTTGNPVALTVNNSTSTGGILTLQDNGGAVFTVADGGDITSTADISINGGDINSSAATLNINAGSTIALLDSATIAGDLNVDTNVLSVSASNNSIGINTSASASAVLSIATSASPGIEIYGTGENDLDIASGRDVVLHLDEDGGSSSESFDIVSGANPLFSVIEESNRGIVFIQGWLRLGVDSFSFSGSITYEPGDSYAEATCNTGGGCTLDFNDSSSAEGQTLFMVNVSANNITINDIDGQQEIAGTYTMGQYDSMMLIYAGDRWIEYSRSDNDP